MLKPGLFYRFGIALVSAALVYAGPPAGAGYLARIGPSVLRFRPTAAPVDPAKVLPPLQMTDEGNPATTADEDNDSPSDPERNAQESANDLLEPSVAPDDSTAVTNAPPAHVVPQLLMHYFGNSTNKEAVVSPPVEFTPPGPPLSRGSSATYISR
jgi:hypothetical protein